MLAYSTLQFVAQIVDVDDRVLKSETLGLDIISGGPYRWISGVALRHINKIIGLPIVPPLYFA